ncbi:hypothetical protein F8271_04275 [Micromonospora sp. ALFpr18c]|uniref:hypothetical protein n=1 Tax=Micromonospora sp. ALFpr18c TaxID=1458665 RepID=UPI00124B6862|nr:hypothetical protein [Micromonospora sp. ALFpr18c]KAB1947546.1 hypothetical protein F8271_04275 [Micromonospora sp. ALFpr18c]
MAQRDNDRQRRRGQALRGFATPYAKAQNALHRVYGDGGAARSRFEVRRSLILRRRPTEGIYGATPAQRSAPVADLITARGWALHLYLVALFEAQSRRRAGSSIQNTRKLQEPDRPGWVDLLPAVTTTADPVAGALRQTKRALTLLSQAHLVRFQRPAGTVDRFDHFQLLLESGESYGLWHQDFYFVPKQDSFGSADTSTRKRRAHVGTRRNYRRRPVAS